MDVDTFRPRASRRRPPRARARLAERLGAAPTAAWGGERGRAPPPCAASTPRRDRIVSYVGKLIVSKGVDLLLAAWPLVVGAVPDARLVVVGFGTYREALGRFVDALARARPGRPARDRRAGPRAGGRAARGRCST